MDRQGERGNHFTTGFLLGLLLGVSITLLLVTKKGRRILKTLSDEGFDNIKDWQNKLRSADVTIDEDLYDEDLEERAEIPGAMSPSDSQSTQKATPPHTNGVKKHKKLFRGIPKKS